MPEPILGLHHVTAIASDPQRNLDFYTQVLGLRLVKRTSVLPQLGQGITMAEPRFAPILL